MFTGIIKAVGRIAATEERGGDVRLSIAAAGLPFSTYALGESIAVNGVCLTAVGFTESGFETDVSRETLGVTALGDLAVGDAVNLEPSVALGERLGGHLVSGHVDCVGRVSQRSEDARSVRFAIEIPRRFAHYVAKKGSICVDGVSLTVNEVSAESFEVNIIPHTAEVTIAGDYAVGRRVNVEVDVLARYLERLLDRDESGLSMDFLRSNGYA